MNKPPLKNRAKAKALDYASYPLRHPISSLLTLIGFSGLPGDVAGWQRWINNVTRDERVLALAEQAAHFGQWVSQPSIRLLLIVIGLVSMFWGLPQFWRLRHKLIFNWRRLLTEDVWIDRDAAIDALRNSTWAELKKPIVGVLDGFAGGLSHGLGPGQRLQKKFSLYLDFTLEGFAECNPHASRQIENGEIEYEEGALRRYAREAMRDEVIKDFGEIPQRSV